MTPNPEDWTAVALGKLTRVLGEERARHTLASTLEASRLAALRSADDLYEFAQTLTESGGFAGAVGGLLSVHAVMHGARGRTAPPRA